MEINAPFRLFGCWRTLKRNDMNRLQLLFYPKEVQHLILELDLLWKKYDSDESVSYTHLTLPTKA